MSACLSCVSCFRPAFHQKQNVRSLNYGFAASVIINIILVGIYWYQKYAGSEERGLEKLLVAYRHTFRGVLTTFVALFGFFPALYADLVLGSVADSLGLHSTDFASLYLGLVHRKETAVDFFLNSCSSLG